MSAGFPVPQNDVIDLRGNVLAIDDVLIDDQSIEGFVSDLQDVEEAVIEINEEIDSLETSIPNTALAAASFVAAAVATKTFTANIQTFLTSGYSTPGDGGHALYRRVVSEPSHAGKLRSVDRFLPNGTTDATNGGWWELTGSFVTPKMFGAKGSLGIVDDGDLINDTQAIQDAFDFASARRTPLHGDGDVYGLYDTIEISSNTTYVGNQTKFVKCFSDESYSHAAFKNVDYLSGSGVATKNLYIEGMWITDADFVEFGSHLTLVDIEDARILDLRIDKTSGTWAFPLAGTDVVVENPRIHILSSALYCDGIHVTRGTRISIINPNIISESDDGIAIHPHQEVWNINGIFEGISDISVIGGCLESVTNAFRLGAQATDEEVGVDWDIAYIQVIGTRLKGGAQLRDERLSDAPMIRHVSFTDVRFDGDDITISAPRSAGTPRYDTVTFKGCTFSDATAGGVVFSMQTAEKAIRVLKLYDCDVGNGRMVLCARDKLDVSNLNLYYAGTANAVQLDCPLILWNGGAVVGVDEPNFAVYLSNGGETVPYARVTNVHIQSVKRGIASNGIAVTFLDARGTTFRDVTVFHIQSSIQSLRRQISGSAAYSAGEIAGNGVKTQTVTVSGLREGDVISASLTGSNTNLRVDAVYSAANTALVRVYNLSGSPITPSGTLAVSATSV